MRISGDDDGGPTIEGVVVDTVAVAVMAVVPSVNVTVGGAMVHVAADGAPVQPSATIWLKPPAGVTVTVKVPLAPCATVSVVGVALTVKLAEAVPVPLNATVGPLGKAVSARRLAVSAAATDGLKTTLTVHEALAAMLVPQVLVAVKSALAAAGEPPVTVALVKVIAALELLVSVTTFAADAVLIV
jgi:hypothetical protein